MGRPRVHDTATATALLDAAEGLVEAEGVDALSVRRIAERAGTTTRAVYSLFGSMPGVLAGLGVRGFEVLGSELLLLPLTNDPVADVVAAGTNGFRRFATAHPALFAVAIQRLDVAPEIRAQTTDAAARAWVPLHQRLDRLPAGYLKDRPVPAAAWQFHAACEGLAGLEIRLQISESLPNIWYDTLHSLVVGWSHSPSGARRRGRR